MRILSDSTEDGSTANDGTIPLDPAVTRELFLEWRSPRFGTLNPERMNNPVWEWLIKSRVSAYHANERFGMLSARESEPCWCFDRLGQSSTLLPDGRLVLIAGEHEDHYDPDFHIYNDVTVLHTDGRVDIFGYPRETFMPTDFHSATLMGDRIVIVGNLGYPDQRQAGKTPVMVLDMETLAISGVQTSGSQPGWIHHHEATLAGDGCSILIQRGKLDRGGEDRSLVENIDDWRLHLADWRWERLTDRRWPRWEVRRADGKPNHLFDYQQALWAKQRPELYGPDGEVAKVVKGFNIPPLAERLGRDPDLELFLRRYKPQIAHEELTDSPAEYNVYRIRIEGVMVRYVEEIDYIHLTVEGELPKVTLDALARDLCEKLSALENAPCELTRL
jgi:hypothetical protein